MSCETTVNTYDVGDEVRITTADDPFTNIEGVKIDPDAVFVKVKDPNGDVTTYEYGVDAEVIRISAGVYHMSVNASLAGDWWYRFYSTGAGQAAAERKFTVRKSEF